MRLALVHTDLILKIIDKSNYKFDLKIKQA